MLPRNVTDEEAAILLRLAEAGIHPADLDRKMREELYRVSFAQLSMNQQSQAYGNYREAVNDPYCSYAGFVCAFASLIDWNSQSGEPWLGRYIHRNDWDFQ